MTSNTMILTGAIRPSFPVQRKDPYIRLADYLCAIRRWLDVETLDHVIYCDASSCNIPEKLFGTEKFESLTMDASEHARKFEAGRAETESLQFVLKNSRKKIESFYKCTGRLFVENFTQLQIKIQSHPNAEMFLRKWYRDDWVDTRFFYMKTYTFQTLVEPHICELTGHAYGGHVIESLFRGFLSAAWSFPMPVFTGHDGHNGHLYDGDYSVEEISAAKKTIASRGMAYFGVH